jgi:hypothetical protein
MAEDTVVTNVINVADQVAKKAGFFKSMISDDSGSVSSIRVVMLVTVGLILLKYAAFNVSALLGHAAPVPFDVSDIGILMTVLGGKVVQSFSENN